MFWKKKPEVAGIESATVAPSTAKPGASEEERAIDTVSAMVRVLGRFSFDTGESDAKSFDELCEGWAQHILVRTPRPGVPVTGGASSPRDWSGLGQFVAQRRRQESEYVKKTVGDLRQIVWAFVHSLTKAAPDETAADTQTKQQMEKLRQAVLSDSVEAIKREALSAVQTINAMVDKRQERQKAQIEYLGEKLQAVSHALEEAEREGLLDALTQLSSRRAFDGELQRTSDINTFIHQSACLAIVDIDRFKDLNDAFGQSIGDQMLKAVSDCLVRTFPGKNDCVARFGGQEFAVLLRQSTLEAAQSLIENRMLKSVRAIAFTEHGTEVKVTVSVGLSAISADERPEAWLERTERALKKAKEQGRNCSVLADSL